MAPKLLLGLVVILIGVAFAAKNPQTVTVSYYFGLAYETYLWVVVIASFFSGILLTSLAWGWSAFKAVRERGRLRKRVAALEKELDQFKKRPRPDEPSVYPSRPVREKQALPPVDEPKALRGKEGEEGEKR